MIRLENLHKSFQVEDRRVSALDGVSLEVAAGEVFGIIGHSGAGKSTLIRCLNLLERPDSGRVWLDEVELTALGKSALQAERQRIGMVFQHFNLLASRTVAGNVAFPLELAGERDRAAIRTRVDELLELVGLSGQRDKYPAQLSGGQKQRVGIARALANHPKLLLCDEATSALDPQTTQSILDLLADINRRLNLTIVLITHEMEVIRRICDRVAVLDGGRIVEIGPVTQVFLYPQHSTTRSFLQDPLHQQELEEAIRHEKAAGRSRIVRLTFTGETTYAPHLHQVAQASGALFSILQGHVGKIKDTPYGQLVVELHGEPAEVATARALFEARGLHCEDI
ncbi:MAG TPA: methionine ABC transporter ATP-binding protein [Candidatus Competibacteraceae bacterium]|nr:methionine ABC transporter ATP-binding protein [Candidatus Competibacteraceae bacterium]